MEGHRVSANHTGPGFQLSGLKSVGLGRHFEGLGVGVEASGFS
jgi:hypothetical protein